MCAWPLRAAVRVPQEDRSIQWCESGGGERFQVSTPRTSVKLSLHAPHKATHSTPPLSQAVLVEDHLSLKSQGHLPGNPTRQCRLLLQQLSSEDVYKRQQLPNFELNHLRLA